jgi:hypothetical protein
VNYKNLLLALGITVSGSQLVDARESSLIEDIGEISSVTRKVPSPVFLEIDVVKDIVQDDTNSGCGDWNIGCSVSNGGCK